MDSTVMQPTRRRKKRPNYGTRSVEICRGKNGFGFTISGQQPCILSSIVANSPADRAGLRPGNYLMAVDRQNVSKALHDDVVQLIGNCHGILKLQIAENYYSDSSEEDMIMTIRQKPKYPYKYKHNGHNTHPFIHVKPQKCNSTFDNLNFDDKFELSKSTDDNVYPCKGPEDSVSNKFGNLDRVNPASIENDSLVQCIVGYLGTIEMPKKLTPSSRHQIVRGCIKRLRADKRNCTPVLMTVFPCSLRLKNENGSTIAVYPGGRVTFCSANNEQSKKYFGIVITSVSEEPSNSCHVFSTLNVIHQEHLKLAYKFRVTCITSSTGECNYFPVSCDPIVNAIRKYYEDNRNNDFEEPLVANSPQPSNDSSVTTSNSDSGIGFRDESGHQSDRILVVDIQNQRLHIQAAGLADPQYIDCCAEKSDRSSSTINPSLPTPRDKLHLNTSNDVESCNNSYQWNAKPYRENAMSSRMASKSFDDLATPVGNFIMTGTLERRLSPKVFANTSDAVTASQSMENLKTPNDLYEDLDITSDFLKKHSLQDLTAYSGDKMLQDCKSNEIMESDRKVTSWAISLEKLLNDMVGLHAFAEFLEKEFSIENVYFWVACEKFRLNNNAEERKKLAHYIFDRFLSNNATDPVNVDSSGKNLNSMQLQTADANLFQNAQKQIFNLMKFDSYPRFLKNEIYKNYLMREIAGENISVSASAVKVDLLTTQSPLKNKNKENVSEDSERTHRTSRRRRSLLPWSRARAKSRDRAASNENMSSCSGSRTSLASWDLALPVSLCRVILPDSSTAVLNIQPAETVQCMVHKLLEKRSMPYDNFQVVLTATDKVVDLNECASSLAGKEIKIEWMIEFRLDLPDRKSLTVRSKPSHSLGAVLGPTLAKYGYNLQMVTLCLMSENEVLEPEMLVGAVDKQSIQVLTRSTPTPNLQSWNYYNVKQKSTSTLDEITNRVFEEVLNGKAENYRHPTNENLQSTHSEDWTSEHSSNILGRFLRKESFYRDKHRRNEKYPEEQITNDKKITNRLPPVIAKWKPTLKSSDNRLEKDGLFEGLRRCQRGRLEDQRGTEINIELPDFLKDKENTPSGRKKMKKIRKEATYEIANVEGETKEDEQSSSKLMEIYQTPDLKNLDEEDNIYANDVLNFDCNSSPPTSVFKEPPPLPPKPKNISWRFSKRPSCYTGSSNIRSNLETAQKCIYLDQPTSSFV